ncbi:MAG TPA: RDD family protein [Prosthecobacter sp.]
MKYHLARGEEQLGTFSDLEISSGLREGSLKPTDLCWTEGMADWQSLETRLKGLATDVGEDYVALDVVDNPQVAALREEVRKDHQLPPVELASLGQRFAAAMIDAFLFFAPLFAIFSIVLDEKLKDQLLPVQHDPQAVAELLQKRILETTTAGNPTLELLSWLMILVSLTNIVLLTVRGQTLGKLMLGIQIVRHVDGGRAGFVKAVLLRGFLFLVVGNLRYLGMVFLVGDVLMIFRQDRRCLHDIVADTRVIKRR